MSTPVMVVMMVIAGAVVAFFIGWEFDDWIALFGIPALRWYLIPVGAVIAVIAGFASGLNKPA